MKFLKKLTSTVLAVAMIVTLIPTYNIKATTTTDSGTIGTVNWVYDSDNILTISGTGEIPDYETDPSLAPWYRYRKNIKKIVFGDGITAIGSMTFKECSEESIEFSNSIITIKDSFQWNNQLKEVILPNSLTSLGQAFKFDYYINKIYIPGSIKDLDTCSFANFSNANIDIGEGCEKLELQSLSGSIDRLSLPSTITYINTSFNNNNTVGVIYGKNDYTKSWAETNAVNYIDATKTYDINNTSASYTTSFEYTGSEIKPTITLTYAHDNNVNVDLIEGIDYTITYSNNTNLGTATATITGKGVYSGTKTLTYNIVSTLAAEDVALGFTSTIYSGSAQEPVVIVTKNGNTLVKDTDYTVSYSNNTNEGQASVVIQGIGNYVGTISKSFNIVKLTLSDANITLSNTAYKYDGTEKTPTVSVSYNNTILTKDTDYSVAYSNNKNEGTATVTITGLNKYKGTITKTFNITKDSIEPLEATLDTTSYVADNTEKKPTVTIAGLIEGTDFTVSYSNNVAPGTATVTITGIGIYKDTKTLTYTINATNIADATVTLNETTFSYDGSEKKPTPTVVLNGKTLTLNTDYVYTYADNINVGTGHVQIAGIGIYNGALDTTFKILPASSEAVYSKDDSLVSDDAVYTIMDDDEVEFTASSVTDSADIQIPATITDENGNEYKVTSIGQKAFYKNTKVTSVTIGNNVTSIEDYAFYGCKNLKTLKIGSGVEVIGASCFRKCTKLTSVTLPKSIDELGKNAFYGCKKLKTITINANSVVDIKANALKNISKTATIDVPKKLIKKYKKALKKSTGYVSTMKVK